jgi:hypothetical protein
MFAHPGVFLYGYFYFIPVSGMNLYKLPFSVSPAECLDFLKHFPRLLICNIVIAPADYKRIQSVQQQPIWN